MKKKTITQLKKLLWKDFSKYIRLRDAIATTGTKDQAKCVTCPRIYPIKKLQAGHFIPGRNNAVLFDEQQVHAQCYSCNMHKAGNWPNYLEYMNNKYGEERVGAMMSGRHQIVKFTHDYLIEKRKEIKQRIKELEGDNFSSEGLPF